jgi:hypothetical protein
VSQAGSAEPTIRNLSGNSPLIGSSDDTTMAANGVSCFKQDSVSGALPATFTGDAVATSAPRVILRAA